MFGSIDNLLRGRYTDRDQLQDGRVELPIAALTCTCILLGGLYGASMGLFSALARPGTEGVIQVIASVIKVPLLFLSTLAVTFPSLYVVSALARSRLRGPEILRLLLAAIAVNLALLASLAPVAAFFTLSTDSYPFIKLLHIVFFVASGAVGLNFLRRTLPGVLGPSLARHGGTGPGEGESSVAGGGPNAPAATSLEFSRGGFDDPEGAGDTAASLPAQRQAQNAPLMGDERSEHTDLVFRVWIVIYGVVGAQMGWILRPFIGDPSIGFSWFRPRDSNFIAAFVEALVGTFGG